MLRHGVIKKYNVRHLRIASAEDPPRLGVDLSSELVKEAVNAVVDVIHADVRNRCQYYVNKSGITCMSTRTVPVLY